MVSQDIQCNEMGTNFKIKHNAVFRKQVGTANPLQHCHWCSSLRMKPLLTNDFGDVTFTIVYFQTEEQAVFLSSHDDLNTWERPPARLWLHVSSQTVMSHNEDWRSMFCCQPKSEKSFDITFPAQLFLSKEQVRAPAVSLMRRTMTPQDCV